MTTEHRLLSPSERAEILRRFLDGENLGAIRVFGVRAAEGAIVEARDIEGVIRQELRRWYR